MDADLIAKVEKIAEAFIAEDHGYRVHACPPEDASTFPIRKRLPADESVIRIVEIDGYDWVACCGTHVVSAAALRLFAILSAEKYKGNTRVYFVAGDRAVAAMARGFGRLKAVAGLLGSSADEAASRVAILLEKAARLEAERGALLRDRARLEVELAAIKAGTAEILSFSFADRSADEAFETAKAGAARGFGAIAVSVPDRCVCVMRVPASDAAAQGQALGQLLKPLLHELGGKGGGGPSNFRAVFETAVQAELFASKAASLLG
jgi:alanyl-tRNA synthetase